MLAYAEDWKNSMRWLKQAKMALHRTWQPSGDPWTANGPFDMQFWMKALKSYVVASASALGLMSLAGVAFAVGSSPGRRQHLPAPSYLDQPGRTELGARMTNHPDEMTRLLMAVTLLDHANAEAMAQTLSDEPPLPRSSSPTNPLRGLPAQVFDLDEQFHDQARKLALAARSGDDTAIAQRFGELTQTCVACHHAYLYPSPAGGSPAPK